ncbi:hypothetical protein [Streptococcus pneumoniae]|uniref:hypothetical protein n=1 Tax=Streptococcus pneumoniae TaxID=1313 RepID=UPI0015DB4654|nr:hypothetical protein [Streptococcus pneumoniae]
MFKLEHALYLSLYTLRKSLQTTSALSATSKPVENLFKPRQRRLGLYIDDFVSSIYNLKAVL